jgi:ABC-type transporter Mla MlaB component
MSCERSNFCIGIRVGEGEKLSNAVFLVGINCFRVFPKRGHVPLPANPVSPTPELQIDTEKAATEIILYRAGRITSSTSNLIQSTVKKSFPDKKTIVLDLSNVSYMDSLGLGALVSVWVSARKQVVS